MVGLEPVTFVGFVAFSFAFWQIRFCAVSRCYVRNETIKLFVRENYQLLCACQECDLSHRRRLPEKFSPQFLQRGHISAACHTYQKVRSN